MAFGYMEGSTAPFCSKREDAGQKQPETQGASALLVCLLSGSSLGMARGWQEKGILDHEESVARTMAGARILVRGVIKKRNKKEDTVTLVLEEVTAEAGRRTGKFRRMVVYAENRTTEKNDSDSGGELAVGVKVQVRGKLAPVEGPGNPGNLISGPITEQRELHAGCTGRTWQWREERQSLITRESQSFGCNVPVYLKRYACRRMWLYLKPCFWEIHLI